MSVDEILNEDEKFPVGMRVLAVDDDRACLKVLEQLLKKCQYEVTICNEAKVALEMLRKNKNRFDIVITDVHMPNMDGLKLLEHVGLEMNLPVLMMSANSDTKMVMKGIQHGACDYLVKPVRIEELQNIWQHVIRKKTRDPKFRNNSDSQNRDRIGISESGNGTNSINISDQNTKRICRKRNDDEEEFEDGEEYRSDNDEPGTQKRPRVVWSIDLHRKFVEAVNQLGINGKGAVPKKILDHMQVEGLTRENVASHLQKYRLYLKRISSGASQSSLVPAGGSESYMRMNTYNNGIGDFQARFPNPATSPYQTGSVLNRLNAPKNLSQGLGNSHSTLSKLTPSLGNINLIGNTINYFPSAQNGEILSNQSSESFNFDKGVLLNIPSNSRLLSEPFIKGPLVPNVNLENSSSPGGNIVKYPLDFSSSEGLFGNLKNSINVPPLDGAMGPFNHGFDQNNGLFERKTDSPLMTCQNNSLVPIMQRNGNDMVAVETNPKPKGEYTMEQWRSQSGFVSTGYDVLDELLMPRREQATVMDDLGLDGYSF